MRLTPEGEVYVIEANPNPWLSSKHEFAMAAKKSGRSYTQLIGEIVEHGHRAHTPQPSTQAPESFRLLSAKAQHFLFRDTASQCDFGRRVSRDRELYRPGR